MKHLKLFFALFAMLALGVGNAWGAEETVTFTNKDWSPWTKITSGSSFESSNSKRGVANNGVNGSCKSSTSYTNITKISYVASSNTTGGKVTIKVGNTTVGESSITKDNNKTYSYDVDNLSGVITLSVTKPSSKTVWVKSITIVTSDEDEPGTTETVYSVTLNQPANGGTIKAEGLNAESKAAKGATITLTATPNADYKFGAWDVKDADNNSITVSKNQFTMPESDVTVTASFVAKTQYTIKWNVAEGSVADTKVYEGDALGNLPTADNCSSGKVFIGWTEATTVNPDGSGITYVKATDVPDGNKVYNAVYAVQEIGSGESGSADVTLSDGVFDSTNKTITWTIDNYATIFQVKGSSQTDVANYTSAPRWYVGHNVTFTPQSGVNITKIVINQGTETKYQEFANATITNADIAVDGSTVTLTPKNGSDPVVIVPTKQLRPTAITIHKGAAISYTDYSLDCEAHEDPFLTIEETSIDFGTVAQNATVTETLNVSGGYLAEDVTLTISGTDASFFAVSPTTIAKADDINETVTVTYNPTATGDHTATLTIKTGDITKEIALSGKVLAPGKWVLVKDVATLSAGDEIIIAAATDNYAIGEAASNNYKGAAITKVGETANADASVTVLTVEETGVTEAPYAFKVGSNYLYAASSSANQLKGKTTLDVNGQWAVTITEGVASIVAAKSSNRNVMQFNPNNGNPIFACYSATTTADVKPLAIYRNSENVVKPVISGDVDFVGSTQVTITAQSGLTVYYTTNGSTPDKTATQYNAPFTIDATTTVKAIAYDASSNASSVAEMTFTKHDLVNVATAMALPVDETAYLSQFEVVYPLKDKSFIYIKDNSGYGLIYDGTLDEQFKAGDRVEGFIGTSSPYKSLPELKAVNKYEDLTITPGVAAEPIEFVTAPTVTDVNKYVVFKNVQFDAAVTFATDAATNTTFTIGSETITLRNNYKFAASLEANKAYDVYGFVATFQQNEGDPIQVQVYFLTAVEAGGVIETYTVTYDANGATGAAPVDETKYQAGQTFYIENQGELVKEGYEFVGWKYNGTIYEAGKQFTMPAENVTFVAQWEEIVVTPRQDFSAGLWVLVTDASELAADDYIIVAAADLNVAMKSYETGNYCTHMAITKSGKNNSFLTWTQEIGVFQLAEENGNYTFQDVNTKQYLYAAGTGKNNYLKAAGEIPVDETAKQYIWTITIEEGITTVKATSDNRNTLKYNKTSGQERFSCYASGQEDIVLYKYTTDFYTRDVAKNQYGTICLDKGGVPVSGATFYEVAWKNTQTNRVFVDEVVRLKAGVPYVFLPNATQIKIALDGTTAGTASEVNGLQGTFDEIQDGPAGTAGNILEGKHVLYNNAIQKCGGNCQLPAYRAYFLVDKITTTEPAQVPGRRRVALDYQGENQATGLDNIGAPENDAVKVLMNGQMIIIRNGEKFNAQGVKL